MNLDSYRLPLYGAARLERSGETVPIRRKALAILYFLALEGVTRREELADLLWPHPGSSVNLRAELHYLRKNFGVELAGAPGLLEPCNKAILDISRQKGDALEGLEGLSAAFDAWLTRKRFELGARPVGGGPLFDTAALAADLPVPGLWILAGPIGVGKLRLAKALAAELDLPFHEGWRPGFEGLSFLGEPLPNLEELERPRDWPRVLVVARPPLGEEPSLILKLRAVYPSERIRYLEMPHLSFVEAQALLGDLPFADAARYYLRSRGRDELLEEMVRARHEMPLKFRAAYKIEARRLRRRSRLALERISVCPESINAELARRSGSEEDLEELERRGWLLYDGGWRFADPVARRALEHDLPTGLKHQYHLRAASVWEEAGEQLIAAWHRLQSGKSRHPQQIAYREGQKYATALLGSETGGNLSKKRIRVGEALPLLESSRRGVGLEQLGSTWFLLRPEFAGEPTWLEFEPFEEDALLHVFGQLWTYAPLSGAFQDGPPLVLHVGGLRLGLGPVNEVKPLDDLWLLPALGSFEYYLPMPAGTLLAIESSADEVAVKFELQALSRDENGKGVSILDIPLNGPAALGTRSGFAGRS